MIASEYTSIKYSSMATLAQVNFLFSNIFYVQLKH